MVAPPLFSGWQPQSRRQEPRRSRCAFFLPWKLSPLTARSSAASPFRASAERPLPDWSILRAFIHKRMSSTDTIRELNDAFRTTFRGGMATSTSRQGLPPLGAITGVLAMHPTIRHVLFGGTALISCAIAGLAVTQPAPPQPPALGCLTGRIRFHSLVRLSPRRVTRANLSLNNRASAGRSPSSTRASSSNRCAISCFTAGSSSLNAANAAISS